MSSTIGAGTGLNNFSRLRESLPNVPNTTSTNLSTRHSNIISSSTTSCTPVPSWSLMPRQDIAVHRFTQYCNNKGVLLLHEVGSGKTLTSLVIALNTIKQNQANNNIIIVCPGGIFSNFHTDLQKIKNENDELLVSDISNILGPTAVGNTINTSRSYFNAKLYGRIIHFYEFRYGDFYRLFDNKKAEYTKKKGMFENLKNTIDDSVIIFDEVHRLLRPFESETYLDLFISRNPFITTPEFPKSPLKTIFMTGTPYNIAFDDILKFKVILEQINNNNNVSVSDTLQYYRINENNNNKFLQFILYSCILLNWLDPSPAGSVISSGISNVIQVAKQIYKDLGFRHLPLSYFSKFKSQLKEINELYNTSIKAIEVNYRNLEDPMIAKTNWKFNPNQTQTSQETSSTTNVSYNEITRDSFNTNYYLNENLQLIPTYSNATFNEISRAPFSTNYHSHNSYPNTFRIGQQGGNRRTNALEILGLDNTATDVNIKKAYRKLALETHTNKTRSNTSQNFIKIKNAYNIAMNKHSANDIYQRNNANESNENLDQIYNEQSIKLFSIFKNKFTENELFTFILVNYSIIMSPEFINYTIKFKNEILSYLNQIRTPDDLLSLIDNFTNSFKNNDLPQCNTDYGILSYVYNTLESIEKIETITPFPSDIIINPAKPIVSHTTNIVESSELFDFGSPSLTDKAKIKGFMDIIEGESTNQKNINQKGGGINTKLIRLMTNIAPHTKLISYIDIIHKAIEKMLIDYEESLTVGNFTNLIVEGLLGPALSISRYILLNPIAIFYTTKIMSEITYLPQVLRTDLYQTYIASRPNYFGTKLYKFISRMFNYDDIFDYSKVFNDIAKYVSFYLKDMKPISFSLYNGKVISNQNTKCLLPGYNKTSLNAFTKYGNNLLVEKTNSFFPKENVRYFYSEYTTNQNLFYSDVHNIAKNENKWWAKLSDVRNIEKNNIRNPVLRSIGNFSIAYIFHEAVYNSQINKYELQQYNLEGNEENKQLFDDLATLPNKHEFACPKFKLMLIQLFLMKCGYIFDNEKGIVQQSHYVYRPDQINQSISINKQSETINKIPLPLEGNTLSYINPTHGFLPFVYSISEFMGLNNFAVFLSMYGLKYELLHTEDNNINAVKKRINNAYPLISRDGSNLREACIREINDLFSTDNIDAQIHKLDSIIERFISIEEFTKYPICILLHPDLTEGINGTYNPAILIMEPPDTYGDYDQLCGRVLRSFSSPYLIERQPQKYILQYVCYTDIDIKNVINNRFTFLDNNAAKGTSFLYSNTGDVSAGILMQEQSRRKNVRYTSALQILAEDMAREISTKENEIRIILERVLNAAEISTTKHTISYLMEFIGKVFHSGTIQFIKQNGKKILNYIRREPEYTITSTIKSYSSYIFDSGFESVKAKLGYPSLSLAIYNYNLEQMKDKLEYYSRQIKHLDSEKQIINIKKTKIISRDPRLINQKNSDEVKELKNKVEKLEKLLNQLYKEDYMLESPDILALKNLYMVEYKIDKFFKNVLDYENNKILDIEMSAQCQLPESANMRTKWCNTVSKDPSEICSPAQINQITNINEYDKLEKLFIETITQKPNINNNKIVQCAYSKYNRFRGYDNALNINCSDNSVPEEIVRTESNQQVVPSLSMPFMQRMRSYIRLGGHRTRRAPKRKFKRRSTIKSKFKPKKYNYHRTFKH